MNFSMKSEIILKPLKRFKLEDGDVLHALKASENEFNGFEEAYFSTIKQNKIKAAVAFKDDYEFNCSYRRG